MHVMALTGWNREFVVTVDVLTDDSGRADEQRQKLTQEQCLPYIAAVGGEPQ